MAVQFELMVADSKKMYKPIITPSLLFLAPQMGQFLIYKVRFLILSYIFSACVSHKTSLSIIYFLPIILFFYVQKDITGEPRRLRETFVFR